MAKKNKDVTNNKVAPLNEQPCNTNQTNTKETQMTTSFTSFVTILDNSSAEDKEFKRVENAIKESLSIGTLDDLTEVTFVNKGAYESALPEGLTKEVVVKVHQYDQLFTQAASSAVVELALEHKIQNVKATFDAGLNKTEVAFNAKVEGPEETTFGKLATAHVSFGCSEDKRYSEIVSWAEEQAKAIFSE